MYLDKLTLLKRELVVAGLWVWRHGVGIIIEQGHKDTRVFFGRFSVKENQEQT